MSGPAAPFMGKGADKSARLLSAAASVNATVAFNGPVSLRHIIGYNARASAVYLKLYALDSTLATPDQTFTPSLTFYLPASSAFALDLGDGYIFHRGMGYRLTTGSADADTGALTAGDILGLNFAAA